MHRLRCCLLLAFGLSFSVTGAAPQTQGEKRPVKKPVSLPRQKQGKSPDGSIAAPSAEPSYSSAAIEMARKGAAILSEKKAGLRSPQVAEPPMLERGARRYAFVVANWNYAELPSLQTPRIDAEAMLDVLAGDGFILTVHYNLGLDEFRKALEEFLKELGPSDFVLFYYAGHGIEVNSKTMLLPVNFRNTDIDVPDARAYPLIEARQLLSRGGRQSLVIVDSCRTSPFAPGATPVRPMSAASAAPEAKEGLIFAASQGDSAFDGEGWNRSYFSRALTYAFRQGELGLRSAANLARAIVIFSTLAEQRPEVSFGSGFEDAPIAAFKYPNGFAPTPLREQVLFSPERERLAAQATIQRLQRTPSPVGLNFRPASVLTVNQQWVERHHADTGNWTSEQKKSAIRFLEGRLRLEAVSEPDAALWAELKKGQYDEDTIWFEEELGFRAADLPTLFEATPEGARTLLKAPDVSGMPVALRALLGYLDAHNLRTIKWNGLNSTNLPNLGNWRTTLAEALDEPNPTRSATMRSVMQACAALSIDRGRECLALIDKFKVASFSDRDKAVLSLFFHLAVEHRLPADQWLAQVLARPTSARAEAFSDALTSLSKFRLAVAPWIKQQIDGLNPKLGNAKLCENLQTLEQRSRVDLLDLLAISSGLGCEPQTDRPVSTRSFWYGQGLVDNDSTTAAIQGTFDAYGVWLGIRDVSRGLENEIMNNSGVADDSVLGTLDDLLNLAQTDAVTNCLPSRNWRELSRRETLALNATTAQTLGVDYYERKRSVALSLFDISAFGLFEELRQRVRDGDWESSWMDRQRGSRANPSFSGCMVSMLRGELLETNDICRDLKAEVNSAADRNDESANTTAIDNAVSIAYWHALAGRTKEAGEELALASKAVAEIRSKAILDKNAIQQEDAEVLGATQFVLAVSGQAADGETIQKGLTFFPYIAAGCGMVSEIR